MNGCWVELDIRDEIVDYIRFNAQRTALPEKFFIDKLGLRADKFISWKKRYGVDNMHNGAQPRDYWLEAWEREEIIAFYKENESEGYRRCTYLMMDQDIVFVSPSTTYRVLKSEGVIANRKKKRATRGNGFDHPALPHEQWHMDISNVKIQGVFYYLICILDGFSRSIVHWDLRPEMKEEDVGIVQQGAREKFPDEHPRYITDNGKQFTGKEFRNFIVDNGFTHWTTSPYYPQSNGKLERFHRSIKGECIKKQCPLTLEDAKRIIAKYIEYYNKERLHSAIGYVAPIDRLTGKDKQIHKERVRKLEERRADRKALRMAKQNTILEEKQELSYQL